MEKRYDTPLKLTASVSFLVHVILGLTRIYVMPSTSSATVQMTRRILVPSFDWGLRICCLGVLLAGVSVPDAVDSALIERCMFDVIRTSHNLGSPGVRIRIGKL
jgi:hypothetical protein